MMSSETLSFNVDFSTDDEAFNFKSPALHNGSINSDITHNAIKNKSYRNSDPIYESVQCSRFLMKRKNNSTNKKPRASNDYVRPNGLLNSSSLTQSSLSSQRSENNSIGSSYSTASSNAFDNRPITPDGPTKPQPHPVTPEKTSLNENKNIINSIIQKDSFSKILSLPRQPFLLSPPVNQILKRTDNDIVKEAFDFLEEL